MPTTPKKSPRTKARPLTVEELAAAALSARPEAETLALAENIPSVLPATPNHVAAPKIATVAIVPIPDDDHRAVVGPRATVFYKTEDDHDYDQVADVEDRAILAHGWKGEAAKVVPWFVGAYNRGQLPGEPFLIQTGKTISNPGAFYRAIRRQLAFTLDCEPRVLQPGGDLVRLYDFYKPAAAVEDIRLQIQVLHREEPKLVCVTFKYEGRLIALHEATASQAYKGLASPGGVDRAALEYLQRLGVTEWHHWTKPTGPLWVATIASLLEQGIYQERDDRYRYFLPNPFWARFDEKPYKSPWIDASAAVVLDPITGQKRNDIPPATGKTAARTPGPRRYPRRASAAKVQTATKREGALAA